MTHHDEVLRNASGAIHRRQAKRWSRNFMRQSSVNFDFVRFVVFVRCHGFFNALVRLPHPPAGVHRYRLNSRRKGLAWIGNDAMIWLPGIMWHHGITMAAVGAAAVVHKNFESFYDGVKKACVTRILGR